MAARRCFTLILAVVAATACKSSKDGADRPEPATKSQPAARDGAAARTQKQGGYLVIPSPEPGVLNPLLQGAFDRASPLIFDGLVGLNSQLQPIPRLAEKWEVTDDGRKITFTLRDGVKWHDGKPFTAEDVVFTVKAMQASRVSVWRGYMMEVENIEAPDPRTVVVTYGQAYAPALATWTMAILPKHLYDGKDLVDNVANREPVGTGPFKFVRWSPQKSVLLEANQAYWLGRPYLDRIELSFEAPDEVEALRAGKLDLGEFSSPNDWAGVAQTPEFREMYETGAHAENTFVVVAWNNQRAPFTDENVRLAMSHALDRPRAIEDVLKGSAQPISGPFSPRMWGGDPAVAPWPYDPARAAKLLDQAAPKDKAGKRFSFELIALTTRRGEVFDELFAVFRHDLEQLGVEMTVTYLPPAEFVARLAKHDFDAALYEWVPDIADPDPYVLLHSSQVAGGANYPGYTSAKMDELLEKGRRTPDREQRKAIYREVHALVHAEQPYTFLWTPMSHYAWNRRVHGVNPIDVGALPRFPGVTRWWVDPSS